MLPTLPPTLQLRHHNEDQHHHRAKLTDSPPLNPECLRTPHHLANSRQVMVLVRHHLDIRLSSQDNRPIRRDPTTDRLHLVTAVVTLATILIPRHQLNNNNRVTNSLHILVSNQQRDINSSSSHLKVFVSTNV